MTEFREWLKERLETLGWTQIELSRRTGLGRNTISRYVLGEKVPTAANERLIRLVMHPDCPYAKHRGDECPQKEVPDGTQNGAAPR